VEKEKTGDFKGPSGRMRERLEKMKKFTKLTLTKRGDSPQKEDSNWGPPDSWRYAWGKDKRGDLGWWWGGTATLADIQRL